LPSSFISPFEGGGGMLRGVGGEFFMKKIILILASSIPKPFESVIAKQGLLPYIFNHE
jgi:hypothetical protein